MIRLTIEQAQQIEEALELAIRTSYSVYYDIKFEASLAAIRAARAQEQAEQEPVAKYMGHRLTPEGTKEFWGYADKPLPEGTLLYAAPVRTKDLTDAEIMLAVGWNDTTNNLIVDICRAVIKAFKEKNNV